MFALLNKYSKVLEIHKSHLCAPVQCIRNNYVNTLVSLVNHKETVLIYQSRNMGLQKSEVSGGAVVSECQECHDREPKDLAVSHG